MAVHSLRGGFWAVLLFGGIALCNPFDHLVIAAAVVPAPLSHSLDGLWKAGPGAAVAVETPFCRGRIGVQAASARFDGTAPDRPAFRTIWTWLEWSGGLRLAEALRFRAGLRLGNAYMRFEPDARFPDLGAIGESELVMGLWGRLAVRVAPAWTLRAEIGHSWMFTRSRIEMTRLRLGVAWAVPTPGWLRRFLDG